MAADLPAPKVPALKRHVTLLEAEVVTDPDPGPHVPGGDPFHAGSVFLGAR